MLQFFLLIWIIIKLQFRAGCGWNWNDTNPSYSAFTEPWQLWRRMSITIIMQRSDSKQKMAAKRYLSGVPHTFCWPIVSPSFKKGCTFRQNCVMLFCPYCAKPSSSVEFVKTWSVFPNKWKGQTSARSPHLFSLDGAQSPTGDSNYEPNKL